MPSNAVVKLRPLRVCQRYRIRFQALPDRIQQLCFLRRREAIDLASQMLAAIDLWQLRHGLKRLLRESAFSP
jgi:hypothetical protein